MWLPCSTAWATQRRRGRRASARSRASTSRKCAIRGASGARRSPLSPTRKGSFPAPRPDRASHQRAHPRGSVRVKELTERLAQGQSVTPEDQAWLTELAVKSQVLESTSKRLDSDAFLQLLMRVDVVPPSLSLAPKASPRFDKQPTPPSESSLSFLLWSIVRAIAGNTQERGGLSTLEGQAKLLCFQ